MLKQRHLQATQRLNREYQVVFETEGLEGGKPDVGDLLYYLWLLVAAYLDFLVLRLSSYGVNHCSIFTDKAAMLSSFHFMQAC